jgi:hypothetical protein
LEKEKPAVVKAPQSETLEFKTRLTGKVLALSALPAGSAGLLLYFAIDAGRKFSPNDPARIPFVGVPLLVALLLLGVVAATMNHFLRREMVIEEDYLVYRDPKTELHLEMSKMAYSPPGESGLLKVLMFSDGETFIQIPQIFMGDQPFATLCEEIGKRRRKARTEKRDTYSL